MEVFFVDVAQGTCQILLIGDRRAIVIDSGAKNSKIPLQFLKRMGIQRLAALITTHSHNDHMGGATAMLGEYQDMIDIVGFVKDGQFLETKYWRRLCEFIDNGFLDKRQLVRLECNPKPQLIWQDREMGAVLRVFAPLAVQNVRAEESDDENATSAILMLDVGARRIIFGADSSLVEWQDIHREFGRIRCDVLVVPHHGGKMHGTSKDLDWLYQEALDAETAIVSVGTSNNYAHPRRDVVQQLVKSKATVICTQMTEQCSDDLELIRISPLVPKAYPGASMDDKAMNSSGRSRNVRCAGTIRVEIDTSKLELEQLLRHQSGVDRLPLSPKCPLCRLRL